MSLSDEINKLQELHAAGTLTDEEFARAKATVLGTDDGPSGPVDLDRTPDQLRQIQLQNEIAQLDREWALEREQYMVTGQYGSRHLPSEGGSIVAGVLIGGFGLCWTVFAASLGAPAFFPFFGVVFILVGVGSCIYSFGKAGEYRAAHERYQRRRAELLAREIRGRH